jgi:PAS domain S-box-containing protein
MQLRTQFVAFVAAALVAGTASLAMAAWSVRQAQTLSGQQTQAASIARQVAGLLVLTQDYLLHTEPRALQQWEKRFGLLLEAVTGYERQQEIAAGHRSSLRREVEGLPGLFDDLKSLPPSGQDTPLLARRRELLVDRLLANVQAVSEQAHEREQDFTRRRDEAETRLMAFAMAAPAVLAMLLSVIGWQLSRRVLRPLASLRVSMIGVAGGDLAVRHGSTARDEIGELSRQFDRMTAQLGKSTDALRASEAMLRLIADNLPAMIGYWDRDQRNRFANADYRRWFGKSPEEIHGRSIQELLGAELYAKNKPYIDAALAGRRQDFDRNIPGPDGVLRHSQASYIPDVHTGTVEGFFVLVTDVTERVRSEQALSQALRDKEVLLREVYHRVKNNLQVVQSLLNLQARAMPEPGAQAALQEMSHRVRAMVLVHEQLHRSESLSEVDLGRYVADLVQQLVQGSGRRTDEITVHTEVAPMAVGVDSAVPLGQLLCELVSNALKHAFADGRHGKIAVSIAPEPDGRGVRISVSDNGCGLPPDFDLDATRSMGLRLAAALAGQLGGELQFRSEDGTMAWVVVPTL